MNIATNPPFLHTALIISRVQILELLNAALRLGEYRYTRQTALDWLSDFPGDIPVSLCYAQALLGEEHPEQALPILVGLCQADPEFNTAIDVLRQTEAQLEKEAAKTNSTTHQSKGARSTAQISTARQRLLIKSVPLHIPHALQQARRSLEQKDLDRAELILRQSLATAPDHPLTAITHLELLAAQAEVPLRSKLDLARHYRQKWPDCLVCTLLLAHWMMENHQPEEAVALLHLAAAHDVGGQVPLRLWGADHRYRSLWPEHLEAPLSQPIPPNLSAVLGWNRLPAGSTVQTTEAGDSLKESPGANPTANTSELEATKPVATIAPTNGGTQAAGSRAEANADTPVVARAPTILPKMAPEELLEMQQELDNIAARLNRPGVTRLDGRFPVYVIFTLRRPLEARYGAQAVANLEKEMQNLAQAVQDERGTSSQPRWNARLYFADDPAYAQAAGLKPITHGDPWELKLTLADLDDALAQRGEMIGAVLIVGGPQIVPFHNLPNPVDDPDMEVPSDNPYATRDENYFIPEWPVGRLPDIVMGGAPGRQEAGRQDIDFMLRTVRQLSANHHRRAGHLPWHQRWWQNLVSQLKLLRVRHASFGYSAAVWKQASMSVFRPIGDSKALFISPPFRPGRQAHGAILQAGTLNHLGSARLGYFNLHGLADAAEWYGQRDPFETGDGPDYPIALRPQDISRCRSIPEVIFSEACYGGFINGKNQDDCVALRLLATGCRGIAASTCMSYGSISDPLIAADLLGNYFWRYLQEGLPSGDALRRAKISLAQEMHHRQGYLDGEDQKTLISFVFYGDPLERVRGISRAPKGVLRPVSPPEQVKIICDRSGNCTENQPLDAETLAAVKQTVAQYLPGMSDAEITCVPEHAGCSRNPSSPANGHTCPTSQFNGKSHPEQPPERRVVTLSKQVNAAGRQHPQFARLTLDKQGRLVKLVISR